jgi:GNAT superfamily N-acetyltransferase
MDLRLREAQGDEDMGFMLGLGSRLADVIQTGNHQVAEITAFQDAYSAANLRNPPVDALTLIAESASRVRLGFVHALPGTDGITGRSIGYVALLAVTEQAEGRGVGRLLFEGVEAWARSKGYVALTLDVFASNTRGKRFYEKSGFVIETLRLVKPLPLPD